MTGVRVDVVRLAHGRDLPLPAYATADSAGMDLLCAETDGVTIEPGKRAMIATGIAIQLPPGFEAQVRPRSGLAAKHGITVLNSPGTIDADYRGEIKVILVNLGDEPVTLGHAERIAQMIIAPVTQVTLNEVESLEASDRGAGGFGSTGLKSQVGG
ncbi:MAG: dUTP diphosphatase [Rhodospirillales bacterium]|nr:dUTP diphosphatase [Rhodospirillales bacterium]MBO6788537.1 dUTP diphosphatase [Rhodospirillales bacterium]